MSRLLFCILLFFVFHAIKAQPTFKIEGCLTNFPYSHVLFSTLDGYATVIDTAIVKNGCFEFNLSADVLPGMYAIVLDKKSNAYIHIVYNGEDIAFKSNFKHLSDSMVFTKSVDNKLFYLNVRYQTNYTRKIDLLTRISALYDTNSDFARQIVSEKKVLHANYENHTNKLLEEAKTSLYAKILQAKQPIKLPENLNKAQQLKYTQLHAFDNIDFQCDALMRTDIIIRFLPEYIALFKESGLTRTQQEDNYRVAVDRILEKSAVSEEMYKFVCRQLEMIFQYGEFEILSAYVKEKRVSSGMCMTEQETTDLKQSIENIKRLAVGQLLPDMQIRDKHNKANTLYAINKAYTAIVFWSTQCGHCTIMLPELLKMYQMSEKNKFEILAVSIDNDEASLISFLKTGTYNWINHHVKLEDRNRILREYNILGTPSFFVLDQNKRIVSKPYSIENLRFELMKLKLLSK